MTEKADLVLKGGRIIDPESGLDEIQDIAFKDGKVSALADSLATMPAKQIHDVSGKIISPGLIDLHTHVYWGGTALGVEAESLTSRSGTTTLSMQEVQAQEIMRVFNVSSLTPVSFVSWDS